MANKLSDVIGGYVDKSAQQMWLSPKKWRQAGVSYERRKHKKSRAKVGKKMKRLEQLLKIAEKQGYMSIIEGK